MYSLIFMDYAALSRDLAAADKAPQMLNGFAMKDNVRAGAALTSDPTALSAAETKRPCV